MCTASRRDASDLLHDRRLAGGVAQLLAQRKQREGLGAREEPRKELDVDAVLDAAQEPRAEEPESGVALDVESLALFDLRLRDEVGEARLERGKPDAEYQRSRLGERQDGVHGVGE